MGAALPFLARRLITVGGFAVAMAAPFVAIVAATPGPPAYLAQCRGGEEPDTFTSSCVPFLTPNTSVTAASAGDVGSCPTGISGTECGTPQDDGLEETANSRAGEAEEAAAGAEQIGEDVAEAEGGLGAP